MFPPDMEIKIEKKEENEPELGDDLIGLPPERLESLPSWKNAYQRYYCTNFSTPTKNLDTSLWVHSNKVSIVYLSPKHLLFDTKQMIKRLNFQITPNLDRLQNKMSGKGKRGAQLLQPDSILCFIETDTDIYPVRSGVFGKLIEINPLIINDPGLMLRDCTQLGWIAIIMQDLRKVDVNLSGLIHEQIYNNIVETKIEPAVEVTMAELDDDDLIAEN